MDLGRERVKGILGGWLIVISILTKTMVKLELKFDE